MHGFNSQARCNSEDMGEWGSLKINYGDSDFILALSTWLVGLLPEKVKSQNDEDEFRGHAQLSVYPKLSFTLLSFPLPPFFPTALSYALFYFP